MAKLVVRRDVPFKRGAVGDGGLRALRDLENDWLGVALMLTPDESMCKASIWASPHDLECSSPGFAPPLVVVARKDI